MPLTIRPVNPLTDDPAIARLWSLCTGRKITADTLKEWYLEPFAATYLLHRAVAVDEKQRTVGYVLLEHETFYEPGRFLVYVLVDPEDQRQGYGAQLYDYAMQVVAELGATAFYATVGENNTDALRFAEKRGFSLLHHTFESTIDLKTFDESRFVGLIEAVEASGIRLFSLADVGDTEEARRKLHHVNFQAVLDDPGGAGNFLSFEEFNAMFNKASWFRPQGQLLAADGDDYIGLSAVGYFAETNSMYNMMTGVMPAYRGRGIAQALKLLTIRFAKAYGADYIRTNNDSTNASMLAINHKLGYQPQPGLYRLTKVQG